MRTALGNWWKSSRDDGGHRDPYAYARHTMVNAQLQGWTRDITDGRVLAAMRQVPRHEFVPDNVREKAYEDCPLPIGYGQTISQPYIVAFMTEKLELRRSDRVLEIGTGCGYQAAVLREIVAEVYSVEIVEPLARQAKQVLSRLGYKNVHIRAGDGYQGWPEAAPFDSITVTCAPENIPQPLIEQLKNGGRMIIPVGEQGVQNLVLLRKHDGKLDQQAILPVRFVPMTGETENSSS